MASNDPVVLGLQPSPTATDAATMDTRAGGSSPNEAVPVFDFATATSRQFMDFYGWLSDKYAGGGLTLTLPFTGTTATTGNVVWQAAFRRMTADAVDVDSSLTYDFNSTTASTSDLSGEVKYPTIAFTAGTDMDSLAAGEAFILRIKRNATATGDTMGGDAELWMVMGRET